MYTFKIIWNNYYDFYKGIRTDIIRPSDRKKCRETNFLKNAIQIISPPRKSPLLTKVVQKNNSWSYIPPNLNNIKKELGMSV